MATLQSIGRSVGRVGKGIGKALATPFVETGQNLFTLAAMADPRTRELLATQGREGFGALSGLIKPQQDLEAINRARQGQTGITPTLFGKQAAGEVLEQGIKPSAGVGAFGVPFGKGASILSRATLPAATSAGLFRFSGVPRGTSAVDTAKQVRNAALIGGAVGTGIDVLRNPQLVKQELGQAFGQPAGQPSLRPAFAGADVGRQPVARFEGQPTPAGVLETAKKGTEVGTTENISKVAEKAARDLKKGGGFSINLKGKNPTGGYQLSQEPARELVVLKADDAGKKAIAAYAKENVDFLTQKGNFLGGWVDEATGRVHFDVSSQIDDLATAVRSAMDTNQIAIWDNAAQAEVRITPKLLQELGLQSLTGASVLQKTLDKIPKVGALGTAAPKFLEAGGDTLRRVPQQLGAITRAAGKKGIKFAPK